MEISRLFQQIPRNSQADGGRHEDQMEQAEQIRQHLRGCGDQGPTQLQLRLVQASVRMLHPIRSQFAMMLSQKGI